MRAGRHDTQVCGHAGMTRRCAGRQAGGGGIHGVQAACSTSWSTCLPAHTAAQQPTQQHISTTAHTAVQYGTILLVQHTTVQHTIGGIIRYDIRPQCALRKAPCIAPYTRGAQLLTCQHQSHTPAPHHTARPHPCNTPHHSTLKPPPPPPPRKAPHNNTNRPLTSPAPHVTPLHPPAPHSTPPHPTSPHSTPPHPTSPHSTPNRRRAAAEATRSALEASEVAVASV